MTIFWARAYLRRQGNLQAEDVYVPTDQTLPTWTQQRKKNTSATYCHQGTQQPPLGQQGHPRRLDLCRTSRQLSAQSTPIPPQHTPRKPPEPVRHPVSGSDGQLLGPNEVQPADTTIGVRADPVFGCECARHLDSGLTTDTSWAQLEDILSTEVTESAWGVRSRFVLGVPRGNSSEQRLQT